MARRHNGEFEVQAVIDKLVRLYLQEGSDVAVTRKLNAGVPTDAWYRIQHARVQSLLSGDPARGIQDTSLRAFQYVLESVPVPSAKNLDIAKPNSPEWNGYPPAVQHWIADISRVRVVVPKTHIDELKKQLVVPGDFVTIGRQTAMSLLMLAEAGQT